MQCSYYSVTGTYLKESGVANTEVCAICIWVDIQLNDVLLITSCITHYCFFYKIMFLHSFCTDLFIIAGLLFIKIMNSTHIFTNAGILVLLRSYLPSTEVNCLHWHYDS